MARQSKPHLHNGYWRVRVSGREIHLGKDRQKAWAKFHRLMARQCDPVSAGRPATVAGAIDVWLRLHPQPKHLIWTRRFAEFAGRVYLDDVTDDQLHNYHDFLLRMKYQPTDKNGKPVGECKYYAQETVRNYVREAASVMRLAAKRRWCEMPEVPALEKPEFVDRSAARVELWAKLDGLPERAGRILRFIAATGCRPGEACRLRWKHVHLAMRACVLPRHKTSKKTGEPRIIALTDEALDVLRKTPQHAADDHVFLNRCHKPYTVQGLRSIAVAHLGITPYDLRHTFAQASLDDGIIPEVVTKMLDHKTSRMVWTYARIRDEQLVEAASRLKLRPAVSA